MSHFKDHFSAAAQGYARHRPGYPPALFAWLAGLAPARERAWDCGCGSGQAALALAEHFAQVVASDPSARQIDHAAPHPRVEYRVAPAEAAPLEAGSCDLVVVAQALHWFDVARFHAEVERVLRPGGVLAEITYQLMRIAPAVDPLIDRFEREVVGPYWPPERAHVDNGYADLPFPYPRLGPPPMEMSAQWDLEALLGYLASWSAVGEYRRRRGEEPLAVLRPELERAWGDPRTVRRVSWPLVVRAGCRPAG